MPIRHILALGLFLTLGVACSSVDNYCERQAECFEDKQCDWNDEACAAEAEGRLVSCNAELEAQMNATATGDDEQCDKCNDAREEYYACAVDLDSCNAFWDASDENSSCRNKYVRMVEACEDDRELCLQ